jgi:hypothetical protein
VTVTVAGTPVTANISGVQSREGIIDTPVSVSTGNGTEIFVSSGTTGNAEHVLGSTGLGRARGSWRQLR